MNKIRKGLKCEMQILCTTMLLQMKQSFARPMFRFCLICNPIVNTVFLYELFLQQGMEAFTNYVVLGAGMMGIWCCICFSSVGDINRERYSGTLSFLYTAPGGFGRIILGKVLGNTVLSLLTFFLSYLTAWMLSGKTIEIHHMGYFVFSFVCLILCFVLVSLLLAYVLVLSRKTELYMNLLEIPFIFICGFTYPIEILPVWLQRIAECFAPTWAVRMLRMSVKNLNVSMYRKSFRMLIFEMVFMTFVTWGLFRLMDRSVRIKGTLEVS